MELKQPMSYEEQLHRLITHGIVVDDRDRAIDILKRVNYYRFTGYALQFRVSPEVCKRYNKTSRFRQLKTSTF